MYRHHAYAGDSSAYLPTGIPWILRCTYWRSLLMPGVLQVDVTSKTEGRAFADATGVPLLVKYDTRLKENVAKNIVQDVTNQVQVRAHRFTAVQERLVLVPVLGQPSLRCGGAAFGRSHANEMAPAAMVRLSQGIPKDAKGLIKAGVLEHFCDSSTAALPS